MTHTRKEALEALLEKVKAGEFDIQPSYPHAPKFNSFMRHAEDAFGLYEPVGLAGLAWDTYQGSLDAALALHDAVLPGEGWGVEWAAKYPSLAFKPAAFCASVGWGARHAAYSDTPARAWLIAIISALISREGEE